MSSQRCFNLLILLLSFNRVKSQFNDVIDLTWEFNNQSIYWTGSQSFKFTKQIAQIRSDGTWYSSNDFCAGEHGGTHLDAPYHFNRHGWKVGNIPLSRLIVTGITIDVSEDTVKTGAETLLTVRHIIEWVQINGEVPSNSVLLVRFGWSQYYHSKQKYLGIDNNGKFNFPGVSAEAAEWIANSTKIVGVGVDTASVDAGMNTRAHQILAEKQIYNLENVLIPATLPPCGYKLLVMPMKIMDGSGAPTRIIALPDNPNGPIASMLVFSASVPWYGHASMIVSSVLLVIVYTTY